ncbi:hypothetical protein [Planococcus lenghuensis]|uniref:Uncharacterized protein n=1 Tax=Planococcus lenghuensis TaxID=2213202 RepID=A0A1Q2L138_9BACL|nr:hypothetical protein [Planococcus lenghuensis]AQQ54170.1 hypothetical protein B0X71_14355 [Planococcus lenghuensis]
MPTITVVILVTGLISAILSTTGSFYLNIANSLGYFWKKANKAGAISSVVFGSGFFMTLMITEAIAHVYQAPLFSSPVGYFTMITGSLVAEAVVRRTKSVQVGQQASQLNE